MNFDELAELVRLNSHTRNKEGVDRNGDIYVNWLQALGFELERYQREQIGDHLMFRSARRPGGRLLLLGHLDTVFPPETFTEFAEDDQWIYGPGVCDMKGGNYVAISALRNLYRERGAIANIDMLLVSDEETGSDDSRSLTAVLAREYDSCLVFEAAGPDHEVVIGRKGVGTFTIRLSGKAAHAGNHYSAGCNANLAAARMVEALTALTDLTQDTTVNVGKMQGGIGANTISPAAELLIELRYTRISERERLLSGLAEIVANPTVEGVKAELNGGIQRDVMAPDMDQADWLGQIEGWLGYPLKTEQRGGVSDANIVAAEGVPTLDGFGPYGDGDHTVHERASKASFERRIAEVTRILLQFDRQSELVEESRKWLEKAPFTE